MFGALSNILCNTNRYNGQCFYYRLGSLVVFKPDFLRANYYGIAAPSHVDFSKVNTQCGLGGCVDCSVLLANYYSYTIRVMVILLAAI